LDLITSVLAGQMKAATKMATLSSQIILLLPEVGLFTPLIQAAWLKAGLTLPMATMPNKP
jgi:hypothetical protein